MSTFIKTFQTLLGNYHPALKMCEPDITLQYIH
jgi:hypothetical protein